ncbi:MAG: hypothetical protein WC637_05925 [Victivallales bacterium]
MFNKNDTETLRRLASRVREISALPIMREREKLWTDLNDLRGKKPLVLVSPEGSWKEIDRLLELKCTDETARGFELSLLRRIYQHEQICDDWIIDSFFNIGWRTSNTGFGVDLKNDVSGVEGGAYKHIPPITNITEGLKKLHFREISVNRDATYELVEKTEKAFGDILDVRIHGGHFWTTGLTIVAITMIGLEELMLYMFDAPDELKTLMKFLSDEMANYMEQLEKLGILSYNNANESVGSGNLGLTSCLPSYSNPVKGPVKFKHLWGFCESQETVGVSPEMFGEFIFPYQKPLIERFGLTYYGCCEPVENRFAYLRNIKNLRCVSVSPWSNIEKCAEVYGRNYVLCRKPNPGLVCVDFAENAIRAEFQETLKAASRLNLMFILKDTHTISNQPERFRRWVSIAREEIASA